MKVGSIQKNSKTRYFAVGGYFSYEEDTIKIKAKYKKENVYNIVLNLRQNRQNMI